MKKADPLNYDSKSIKIKKKSNKNSAPSNFIHSGSSDFISPNFSFLEYSNFFVFFLVLAICGYISLMVSSDPYNDDYCRNFASLHVGTLSSLRCLTFLLEDIMYLNGPITDAAPFTQLVASVFLAFSAVLCMRIFDVNKSDKWEILCLFPIIVNPYLLEVMMYHFDSPFIALSLFFVVLSAYFSSFNSKKWLFIQTSMLFLSFFIYQAASSAYLVIFLYKFMKEIEKQVSSRKHFYAAFYKMRYWIYSLILCLLFYAPFVSFISYCTDSNGDIFIIPNSIENGRAICQNIIEYFGTIYHDWSGNLSGRIFLCLFAMFAIMSIVRILRFSKLSEPLTAQLPASRPMASQHAASQSLASSSISSSAVSSTAFSSSHVARLNIALAIFVVLGSFFLLILAPCGVYPFLRSAIFAGNVSIPPRVMCSMGFLIAIVLRDNYFTFRNINLGRGIYRCIVSVLCLWSVVFLNSAGNIIHYFRILEDFVIYDISKDIFEVTRDNEEISELCFKGAILSPAITNFAKEYPMVDRIVPEKWHAPTYCRMALMNPYFPILDGTGENYMDGEHKYRSKEKLRETMWYTSYIVDKKLLLFELKGKSKWSDPATPILKVFRNNFE